MICEGSCNKTFMPNNCLFGFDLNVASSRGKNGETVKTYLKRRKSVEYYLDIMAVVAPSDPNFQKKFDDFYGLGVARNMNKQNFYKVFNDFYNHMQYVSYRNILNVLKSINGTLRTEVSFGSKILHTIDSDEPIIDRQVIDKLRSCFFTKKYFLKIPKNVRNIDSAVDLHNALKCCYVDFLIPYAKSVGYFYEFDKEFSKATHISEVKKIDFYLWSM